jgi:hypothetical protein
VHCTLKLYVCEYGRYGELSTEYQPPSSAVGLSFLRCGGASPPAATRSRKNHVAHRRIKIERVYRPYLTATEAASSQNPALR